MQPISFFVGTLFDCVIMYPRDGQKMVCGSFQMSGLTRCGFDSGEFEKAMKRFKVGRSREARLWLDNDLPRVTANPKTPPKSIDLLGAAGDENVRRAGIEIRVRAGPRTLFGFLECTVRSNGVYDEVQIVVERNVSSEAASIMADWFEDPVMFGLIDEYEAAVLEGATLSEGRHRMHGKSASFGIAVHDTVGSAPVVFQFLARTLMDVLASDPWPPSDEWMVSLLARPW